MSNKNNRILSMSDSAFICIQSGELAFNDIIYYSQTRYSVCYLAEKERGS
jgi:hypothetical protein